MRPYVSEAIGIGRIHIQAHDVLRTHAGIGEDRQCVLPDLVVLRLESIRNGTVRSDANLACREKPAGVWRYLDGMRILRGRWGDAGRIASLEHAAPFYWLDVCFRCRPLIDRQSLRSAALSAFGP